MEVEHECSRVSPIFVFLWFWIVFHWAMIMGERVSFALWGTKNLQHLPLSLQSLANIPPLLADFPPTSPRDATGPQGTATLKKRSEHEVAWKFTYTHTHTLEAIWYRTKVLIYHYIFFHFGNSFKLYTRKHDNGKTTTIWVDVSLIKDGDFPLWY